MDDYSEEVRIGCFDLYGIKLRSAKIAETARFIYDKSKKNVTFNFNFGFDIIIEGVKRRE